jgi:hypothetical protein
MVIHKIPHTARFLPTTTGFTAGFNTPTLGKYNFGVPGNVGRVIIPLDVNTTYFLDNMQIGGDIPQEEFLAAINTTPQITFKKVINNEIIYTTKIPLVLYSQEKPLTCFFRTDKGNDALIVDLEGILNQTFFLLGRSSVTLSMTLAIYAMDERDYNENFKRGTPDQTYRRG